MNFLAHFYLAGLDESLLTGNFVADWVKGSRWKNFPDDIATGILHHRFIDSYTDSHPATLAMTARLRPTQSKYAGVVADIIYDHMLAVKFADYSDYAVQEFAAYVYEVLGRQRDILPEQALFTLEHMRKYDWLSGYSHVDGVERSFRGLSGRVKHENNMAQAHRFLEQHYEFFITTFNTFFPDLQHASETWLLQHRNVNRSL